MVSLWHLVLQCQGPFLLSTSLLPTLSYPFPPPPMDMPVLHWFLPLIFCNGHFCCSSPIHRKFKTPLPCLLYMVIPLHEHPTPPLYPAGVIHFSLFSRWAFCSSDRILSSYQNHHIFSLYFFLANVAVFTNAYYFYFISHIFTLLIHLF